MSSSYTSDVTRGDDHNISWYVLDVCLDRSVEDHGRRQNLRTLMAASGASSLVGHLARMRFPKRDLS